MMRYVVFGFQGLPHLHSKLLREVFRHPGSIVDRQLVLSATLDVKSEGE
jgi:hypothetical protein